MPFENGNYYRDQTTVIEFKNIEIKDIPDSMFELPGGVEVMDFEMPQIP